MGFDVAAGLGHPLGHVFKGHSLAQVVDEQHSHRVSVVGFGDAPKPLLTGCVPQLELDGRHTVVHSHQAGEKVHSDCRVGHLYT